MTIPTELIELFNNVVADYGQRIRLKYYIYSYSGAEYDNAYLASSGNSIWVDGRQSVVSSSNSSEDYKKVQQGAIQFNDTVLYIPGSVTTQINGSGITTKIGIGSPTSTEYFLIDNGRNVYNVSGTDIYQKLYVRLLNNGSFINEVS